LTRGDASSQNDVPVPIHRVLGRVKLIERAGEQIKMVQPKKSMPNQFFGWLQRLKFW
jgi:hypothetical protein